MAHTRGPVFVLALVGALLLGTGLAYWLERADSARSGGDASSEDERDVRVPATREASEPGPAERVAAMAGEPPPADPAAAERALPRGELAGRVVDARGRPLAGARVVILRGEAREFTLLEPETSRIETPLAETQSDGSGTFRFELARGTPVDVRASLAGFCDALAVDAYAGQELELALEPGVLVHGTLTRARDGSPVEGAEVRVFRLGGPLTLERATTSLADGSYRLRIPFREDATLEVVPRLEQSSAWIALEVGPDDRCQRDVVLESGVVVQGRVTDAVSGLPIAGALVGEGAWFRRTATTDARGEYRLDGYGAPLARELAARAAGYSRTSTAKVPAAVEGVVRLDFALAPARAVRGRVVDEGGAPLAGAYVAAVASAWVGGAQRSDGPSARTGADGRYRIADLASDLAHALLVMQPGYGTAVHDLPESELATKELELPDVVLRAPALLAGRVEDPTGNGLAGVTLELLGSNRDRARFAPGTPARARFFVDRREVVSDARGRFWFGSLSGGSYQLVTRAAGRPESAPLVLELATGELREDLVLRLDAGGALRGEVLDVRGAPLAGVYVSAQGERLRGDALPAAQAFASTGADGRFELTGLPEGEYTLRAYPLETENSDPSAPWLPATVEHVATGAGATRIELLRGASIRGRVLDASGAPLAGFVVATVRASGEPGEFSQTDGEGRFALAVPRNSSWSLEVRGPPQSADFRTVFLRREDVAAGAELELRLEK